MALYEHKRVIKHAIQRLRDTLHEDIIRLSEDPSKEPLNKMLREIRDADVAKALEEAGYPMLRKKI